MRSPVKYLKIAFLSLAFIMTFAQGGVAHAQVTVGPCSAGGNFLSFPTWYKYLDKELVQGKCTPRIFGFISIVLILLAIVEIMLRVAGIVAIFFVIVGGIRYIMSQGQPEDTKRAKQTVVNALIGVVVSVIASVVVTFLGTRLG